ncbi:hypothetical protein BAUCODRAFT_385972 [Baudoinia panamericana UAMH 10762]|uniref:RING-type domain-containing protein n=1 Tax=Baudoinia panamericana (strain UAMH 10762) TaxID=717646 RepID=M2N4P1_BAUPA|nr:uncharacterized protein BAUCODRAFT_385972 [Baudoinia panamericana UAMH 10762]EMC98948.1 hypothetical protein BAUCODRAFT_385972 [Baudoinia panamericana UAMH 10762]
MALLDATAIEVARSLTIESIPPKLRCGVCNKLAIDAVKLPCCDTSLCLTCSRDLGETCPICTHSPITPDDCTPVKNLRTTINAYIKTEQKKRSKLAGVPSTPAVNEAAVPALAPAADLISQETAATEDAVKEQTPLVEPTNSAQSDDAVVEETGGQLEATNGNDAQDDNDEAEDYEDEDDMVKIITHKEETDNAAQPPKYEHQNNEAAATEEQQQGYDGVDQAGADQHQGYGDFAQHNQQNGFGNGGAMDFSNMSAGFNPMMAGMNMSGFGGMGMPNMMGKSPSNFLPRRSRRSVSHRDGLRRRRVGMPGMMDPSMMFGAGGFGGMGDMSMMGMNMGGPMGMAGFGGMMNGGGFGGPGNFNGPHGYNNQNFGPHINQQQFRNDRGFGGRPYGRGYNRGRGYNQYNRGRGGYGYQNFNQQNNNFGRNQGYANQAPQQYAEEESAEPPRPSGRRPSPSYAPMNGAGPSDRQTSRDAQTHDPETVDDTNPAESANIAAINDDSKDAVASIEEHAAGEIVDQGDDPANQDEVDLQNINQTSAINEDQEGQATAQGADTTAFDAQDALDQEPQPYNDVQAHNLAPRGRGGFRGGRGNFVSGRGAYGPNGMQSDATDLTPTPAPPINAPSGPKAMREGKPNTGWYSRIQPTPPVQPRAPPPATPTPRPDDSRSVVTDREGRDHDRDHDDGARSDSRHRSRKRHHRDEEDGYESEESRRYRKEKERKHRDRKDRSSKYDEEDDDRSSRKNRSREESRDADHDRRGSRSHRERSKERRKHRRRSRSPDRESNVDGEEKSRRKSKSDRKYDDDYSRGKDRSKRHRDDKYEDDDRSHRHRRTSRDDGKERDRAGEREVVKPAIEPESDDVGFRIKGSKSAAINPGGMGPPLRRPSDRHERRSSMAESAPQTPSTPTSTNVYDEERKRRQADRVAKEQQRRQSTTLGKRMSRDEEEVEGQAPTEPKTDTGRKKSKKERRVSVRDIGMEQEIAGVTAMETHGSLRELIV